MEDCRGNRLHEAVTSVPNYLAQFFAMSNNQDQRPEERTGQHDFSASRLRYRSSNEREIRMLIR